MPQRIPVRNLYYLFAYAWDQFELARRAQAGTETDGPEGAAFFARILVQACRHLFRRGLDRTYQEFREETSRPRGRIDVAETLLRDLLRQGRAICNIEELRHNAPHNQLLKVTLRRLLEHPDVPGVLRSELRQVIRMFDAAGVSDIRASRQAFRRIQLDRNSAYYGFLLHVCELVHEGFFPEEGTNGRPFAMLLNDEKRMGALFERFVRNLLLREQSSYTVGSERIAWDLDAANEDSLKLLPGMRTDVSLRSPDRTIIVDTKYYAETLQLHFGRATVRSDHLYQLFAYVKNLEARGGPDTRAEGVLLYPVVDTPIDMRVSIQGHQLRALTVNLTQPWPDIRQQILSVLE